MKKYNIILADPPWQYGTPNSKGAPEKHYPTMPLKDICALPIKELADDDCALFLWATMPFLRESFEVLMHGDSSTLQQDSCGSKHINMPMDSELVWAIGLAPMLKYV